MTLNAWLHLKSFLHAPRRYLQAVQHRHEYANTQRWHTDTILNDNWNARTTLMATMIPPGSSVFEFGAGRQILAGLIAATGGEYQPCDLVARNDHTIVCDLNQGFPAMDRTWDVMVFSGVLEYIHDLERLLRQVRWHSRACLCSYTVVDDLRCMTTRLENGWVNHLSADTLERYFCNAGFTIAETRRWENGIHRQRIYRIQSTGPGLIS